MKGGRSKFGDEDACSLQGDSRLPGRSWRRTAFLILWLPGMLLLFGLTDCLQFQWINWVVFFGQGIRGMCSRFDEVIYQSFEQRGDILVWLCAGFKEMRREGFAHLHAFFARHFMVRNVYFVRHEVGGIRRDSMLIYRCFQICLCCDECFFRRHIVNADAGVRSLIVWVGQGGESFLSCGVPNLEFNDFVALGHHGFQAEINADGWDVALAELIFNILVENRRLAYALRSD